MSVDSIQALVIFNNSVWSQVAFSSNMVVSLVGIVFNLFLADGYVMHKYGAGRQAKLPRMTAW